MILETQEEFCQNETNEAKPVDVASLSARTLRESHLSGGGTFIGIVPIAAIDRAQAVECDGE